MHASNTVAVQCLVNPHLREVSTTRRPHAKLRSYGISVPHVCLGARVTERRRYKTPPIAEAVCEIRYASDDWDPTIPGRMQERLAERYDGKPQERQQIQFGLMNVDSPDGKGAEIRGRQQSRIQLRNHAGTSILSIAEDTLSVSDLKPYSGWQDFRDRIEEALQTYHDLASPTTVTRIGVRYINRVLVPAEVDNLGDYFNVTPQLPADLDATMHTFLSRSESRYDDQIGLTVTFAKLESEPGQSSFILDLDVWTDTEVATESALRKITRLRDREREAFEQSITDRARSLFDGNA